MHEIKMLCYNRIESSEGIDVNKTSTIDTFCHCWFFLVKGSEFQPYICSLCLDFLMISMNLSKIYILDIKSTDYLCIIDGISKGEAINLIWNTENSGQL